MRSLNKTGDIFVIIIQNVYSSMGNLPKKLNSNLVKTPKFFENFSCGRFFTLISGNLFIEDGTSDF